MIVRKDRNPGEADDGGVWSLNPMSQSTRPVYVFGGLGCGHGVGG